MPRLKKSPVRKFMISVGQSLKLEVTISFFGSVFAVAALITSIIFLYQSKLQIQTIAEVTRINGSLIGFETRPISQINVRATPQTIAWTGYGIGLVDFCASTKGSIPSEFFDALKSGKAKLVIPDRSRSEWTVANANFTFDACNRIEKDKSKYQNVEVVFDNQIPGLEGWSKQLYLSKDAYFEKLVRGPFPIPIPRPNIQQQ